MIVLGFDFENFIIKALNSKDLIKMYSLYSFSCLAIFFIVLFFS